VARPKLHRSQLTRYDPRWRNFGKWLRRGRLNNHVALKDAAKAAGVSPRQFSRYESGTCSVPPERIAEVARAVRMPLGRTMMEAGYKDRSRELDPENELGWLWTYLLRGDVARALRIVIELHLELEVDRGRPPLRLPNSATAAAFTSALLGIGRLPGWLCEELIPFIQMRHKREDPVSYLSESPEYKNAVRERIRIALSKPVVYDVS
jgi:transcriptional regulator with XRE-family HTH domain